MLFSKAAKKNNNLQISATHTFTFAHRETQEKDSIWIFPHLLCRLKSDTFHHHTFASELSGGVKRQAANEYMEAGVHAAYKHMELTKTRDLKDSWMNGSQ